MVKNFKLLPSGMENESIPRSGLASDTVSKFIIPDHERDAPFFRALERNNIFLNQPQVEAVRHYQGPILTLAGAGSGKTSVLICRTGYLMAVKGVAPQHILLVTFTRKAADEMKERINKLPGVSWSMTKQIQASTFHAFFLKLLKSRGFDHEILSNERFKHITIKMIMREMGIDDSYQPETLIALFSNYKMNMISIDQLPEKTKGDKEIKEVYKRYEVWKRKNHKMDFDDILVNAYELLKRDPKLLLSLQKRFRFIMVDEFQDTNLIQYELIKQIAKAHGNLFVVGDDDQTIYSFNGARNEFILNFKDEFPTAKTVTLDINYRSNDSIIGLGNAVIKNNRNRKEKTLKGMRTSEEQVPYYGRPANTDEEAEWIVEDISEKVSVGTHRYGDFAILHRAASNSRAIFEKMTMDEVPFVSYVSDAFFYDHWVIKPVLDHLRLSITPRDFSAIEGILPTLYINREKGLEFIQTKELEQKKKYPLIHLTSMHHLKEFQKGKIKERIQWIKSVKGQEPLAAIKQIRSKFYNQYIDANDSQSLTLHKESMKEILDELEASAKRFQTIASFLTFINDMKRKQEDMKELMRDHKADVVKLMTIHRSKGLEFPSVYVIGVSEGILPHSTALEAGKMEDAVSVTMEQQKVKEAVEEERRLAYVAISRAMNELLITSPEYYRGKRVMVSRFLEEAFNKPALKKSKSQRLTKNADHKRTVTNSRSNTDTEEKPLITVLAWICNSPNCRAWVRIRTEPESKLPKRDCPICKGNMIVGEKEIN
ncbi:ATP-dependent helicase [Evansella tamaricis]|uniref:DNA 3'-5' helicase n=1 Tax=Evansella tamaricis TaxID=2069301 RepID=A0ABS6JBG0_9BACI|nr:UvrD-helicase domain-containing protein [Evansella tamaricis]MBU9710760.1 UvrD-helicase domain-containing protein [Evansella tamaricis]